MNTAGPIATTIFVVTTLSVVAALVAYIIFKARGRTRKKSAASASDLSFTYFAEYTLPDAAPMAEAAPAPSSGLWMGLTLLSIAITLTLTAVVIYLLMREPPERAEPPAPAPIAAIVVAPPDAGVVTRVVDAGVVAAAAPDAGPKVVEHRRGPAPDFSKVRSVKPSLFASAKMDRNQDGKIQPEELTLIHGRVPQFVLVSSEENGSVEGMSWLEQEFRRRGIWGKVTYFFTANYLPGRKNYPGGPVLEHWQRAFFENYGAMNGTTYAPGAQFWNLDRWDEELGTAQEEVSNRIRLAKGWEWRTYPWGSRSPQFVVSDVYMQALKRLRYRAVYDASVVMYPGGKDGKPAPNAPRNLPWPFTLDHELPEGFEVPGLPKGAGRGALRTQGVWELPAYAWFLSTAGADPTWHPPMDQSLWTQFGCPGEAVRQQAVDELINNLKAHYRGNRAPFMFGVRPQSYVKEEVCKRETLSAIFARIDELIARGYNIRYSSMPDFIQWMSGK